MIPLAFILALIAVESSGNNAAVGDNGRAIGCLQIHAGVVKDVNRVAKTQFKHSDARDRQISILMCRIYLEHHCGRNASYEQMARVWNGGPTGWKGVKTDAYWAKVRRQLLTYEIHTDRPHAVRRP